MAVVILLLIAQAGGLNWAVKNGDLATASALLTVGADPNYRDRFGATPLHHAVFNNRADLVVILLDNKADGNVTSFGLTPLHYAVSYDRPDLAALLLDHKADVNARTLQGGSTPLDLAVMRNNARLAKLLLDRGADVRAAHSGDGTVLHMAAAHCSV